MLLTTFLGSITNPRSTGKTLCTIEYILKHKVTLAVTLGYILTDSQDDTSKLSKVIARIKDWYDHICQLHIDRGYQQNSKRRY